MAVRGQFTWKETPTAVHVTIPLKGCPPRNVDIYATDSILKVNYVPYLIDITLKHTIKPDEHKARVKDGVLTIIVQKEHEGLWGELAADPASEDIESRRNQSIVRQQEAENQKRQKQLDRKNEDSRKALRQQMAIEESERQALDDIKSEQKRQAEEEMYAAFAQLQSSSITDKARVQSNTTAEHLPGTVNTSVGGKSLLNDIDEEEDGQDDVKEHDEIESTKSARSVEAEEIDCDESGLHPEPTMFDDIVDLTAPETERSETEASNNNNDVSSNSLRGDDEDQSAELRFIPPPRSTTRPNTKHTIDFTPRIFPTPLRESKAAEEEDWMVRNRRYLKDHGVLGKHISRKDGVNIEDEDPTWLKAKGDDFYRGNDFRSAINAYSAALDIDPKHIACLVNRSACYLQVGDAAQCITDCTKALQLVEQLPPPLDTMGNPMHRPENTKQQVKILARRAAAHCQREEFQRAVEDFRAALALISVASALDVSLANIEQLKQDLETVELLALCDAHKKAGDAALSQNDVARAVVEYTAAIEQIPNHVACLSNRAACHLANEDYEACVNDCSQALALLQHASSTQAKHAGIDLYACIVPAPGSEKRKKWVLRTLTRKAASLVKLSRIEDAIECYEMAVVLAPNDQNLASDLQLLRTAVSTANE